MAHSRENKFGFPELSPVWPLTIISRIAPPARYPSNAAA
jgi:hypothetical protein